MTSLAPSLTTRQSPLQRKPREAAAFNRARMPKAIPTGRFDIRPRRRCISRLSKQSFSNFESYQIAPKRRVGISTFKSNTLINIREYYEADGEMKPGKKVSRNPLTSGNPFPPPLIY